MVKDGAALVKVERNQVKDALDWSIKERTWFESIDRVPESTSKAAGFQQINPKRQRGRVSAGRQRVEPGRGRARPRRKWPGSRRKWLRPRRNESTPQRTRRRPPRIWPGSARHRVRSPREGSRRRRSQVTPGRNRDGTGGRRGRLQRSGLEAPRHRFFPGSEKAGLHASLAAIRFRPAQFKREKSQRFAASRADIQKDQGSAEFLGTADPFNPRHARPAALRSILDREDLHHGLLAGTGC
jgi:hypothetical protein